jgi:photosystem II stability/assembly factor-like uncharacterized protein
MRRLILFCLFPIILSSGRFVRSQEPFWEYIEKPNAGNVEKVLINSKDQVFLFSDNGVFRSSDGAESWEHIFKERIMRYASIGYNDFIIATKGDRFSSTHEQKLFISTDDGESWKELEKKWDIGVEDPYQINHILISDKGTIYLILQCWDSHNRHFRLAKSTDLGESWEKIDFDTDCIDYCYYFQLDETPDGDLLIFGYDHFNGRYYGTVKKYSEQNDEWIRYLTGFGAIMDSYFLSESEFFLGESTGLYYTDSSGESWKELLQSEQIYQMDLRDSNNYYVCALDGFYYSSNKGDTWGKKMQRHERFSD